MDRLPFFFSFGCAYFSATLAAAKKMAAKKTYLTLVIIWFSSFFAFAQKPIPNAPIAPTAYIKDYRQYFPLPTETDDLTYNQKCWLVALYKSSSSLRAGLEADSALSLITKALETAQKYKLQDFIPSVYFQLGNFYSSHAEYHKAIEAFYQGIEYYEEGKLYGSYMGYPYIDIGNLFYKLHRYTRAEEFFKKAYRLFALQEGFDYHWGKAIALNNIGLSLMKREAPDSALVYFEKAMALREQLVATGKSDSAVLLHSYIYIQKAHREMGNLSEATTFLQRAIRLERSVSPNNKFNAEITLQYAELLFEEQDYKSALTYALSALEKADLFVSNKNFHIDVYQHLARIYLKLKQVAAAKRILSSSIELAKKNVNHERVVELLQLKLQALEQEGDYKSLPEVYSQIDVYQDSLRLKQEAALATLFDFNLELATAKVMNLALTKSNERIQEDMKAGRLINLSLAAFLLLTIILGSIIYLQYTRALKAKAVEKVVRKRNTHLINSVDNTIICLSLKGEIVLINKAGCDFYKRILGVELKEGDNFLAMLTSKGKRKLWHDTFERLLENPTGWVDERYVQFDQPMYLQRTITPIFTPEGMLNGLIVVGTDVTAAKLQEHDLRQQKKKLDSSDAAKQQMLNLLAHDLKDVVYSSHNLSQLVIESPEEYDRETLLEFFKMLNVNFAKNKDMMESLLSWAKTQVGGVRAQITEVDIARLVEESISLMSSRAIDKKIELVSTIHEAVCVKADFDMIKAVLRNLISNALKFTESKTGKISVTVTAKDKLVQICVKDNGIGMTKDQIQKVLERPGLSQTEGTAGEIGSGFGLSICQGYLELNSSVLEIHSEPNKGSSFCFCLPKA